MSPNHQHDIWFFNTNETYGAGAYPRIFERGVIAIYGYASRSQKLEGSRVGDIVLPYVNKQGIRGLGTILDACVRPGRGIFLDERGSQREAEYHVHVEWNVLLPRDLAISAREAVDLFGYHLPVRTTFGVLRSTGAARRVVAEVGHRARARPPA